jgi:hypothetical protein
LFLWCQTAVLLRESAATGDHRTIASRDQVYQAAEVARKWSNDLISLVIFGRNPLDSQ